MSSMFMFIILLQGISAIREAINKTFYHKHVMRH